MTFIRRLDTSHKLFACFALVLCLSSALALWMLDQMAQLSALSSITARTGQKLSAAQSHYAGVRVWAWFLISASVGVGAALAVWLRTEVTRPVNKAAEMAQRVAGGDLSTRFDEADNTDAGGLLGNMQAMNDKLVGMIVKVRAGSESVAGSAASIAAGVGNLSVRIEEQSAALEESATAAMRMSVSARQTSGLSREAHMLALSAVQAGRQSSAAVAEVADSMAVIGAAAKRVAGMIEVIEAIALQSNVLALNAAVEAAHAGKQASGLGVVADEVRLLAERAAVAATELKVLVGDTAACVAAGAALADKADRSVHHVVDSTAHLSDLTEAVAGSGLTLCVESEQVHLAVASMDQAIRHSARLVEQANVAATAMRDEAGSLSRATAAFSLGKKYGAVSLLQLVSSNPNKLVRPTAVRGRAKLVPVCVVVSNPPAPPLVAPASAPLRSRSGAARRDLDWEEF